MRQILMLIIGLILAVAFAAWLAVQFLCSPWSCPEAKIVMATSGADGAYTKLAKSWEKELKRFGVELVLDEKLESVKAYKKLVDGKIDAGFIRGGYLTSLKYRDMSRSERDKFTEQARNLRSVGRMFHEPLWVYYRGPDLAKSLGDFNKGHRIMIGSPDSGTADVVKLLLRVNGLFGERGESGGDPPPPEPLPKRFIEQDISNEQPLTDDRAAVGAADVAFIPLPSDHETVRYLLHQSNILLMDFSDQADAYISRFPFLSKLVMHRGSFRLHPDLPWADITLLATTPALVVREKLHPALVSLLTHVSLVNPKPGIDRQGYPVVFYQAGQFPNINDPEYEVDPTAEVYYKSRELPLLLRTVGQFNADVGIPFWVTAVAYQHGTKIVLLAIPILSILIPLGRFLPLFYAWVNRRRLLRWYDRLKALEMTLNKGEPTPQQVAFVHEELQSIDHAVSRLRMPRQFSGQLYELRSHINLVERRLNLKQAP